MTIKDQYREAARYLPTTGVLTEVSEMAKVSIQPGGAYVTTRVWIPISAIEPEVLRSPRRRNFAGGDRVAYDTRDRAR